MSTFYATDTSSLQLMRNGFFPRPHENLSFVPVTLNDAATCARDVKSIARDSAAVRSLEHPYCLLVPDASKRRYSASVRCRVAPRTMKEPFLVSVDEHCASVIPELLFVQLCQQKSLAANVELAMELCGTYAKPPSARRGALTRYDLLPLTSCIDLRGFLERNRQLKGSRTAMEALGFAQDRSASPMETAIYMLLCLPVGQGGYGLPLPTLNAKLEVTDYLSQRHDPRTRYGDLVFTEGSVVLEYQSREFHEQRMQWDADEDRRDDIEAAGYTVMFVTPSRVRDLERFEGIAKRLAHHVGVSLGTRSMGPTPERLALRRQLLG